MKKKVLVLATLFAATTTFAQDLTSRKGEPYLPEAGDWAISFDAAPFLNYAGQLFSNAGAVSPTAGYTNGYPWSIRGKMFSTETMAYRAGLRIGFGSETMTALIDLASDNNNPLPAYPNLAATVEDEFKASYNAIVLSGGVEMRRGKTRLQGYYGGELLIGFGGMKDTYTYGNALNTATDATGVGGSNGTSWNGGANFTTDDFGNTARYTERKVSSVMIGLRGFIGVEYFIMPKISVGAEYGWGLGFGSTTMTDTFESRGIDGSGNFALGNFTNENKSSGFAIDSDIQNGMTGMAGGSGSLNIIFHF